MTNDFHTLRSAIGAGDAKKSHRETAHSWDTVRKKSIGKIIGEAQKMRVEEKQSRCSKDL